MRICKTCEVDKPLSDFNGGRNHCKVCNRKKYYDKVKQGIFDTDGIKECSRCNESKDSSEFRTHRTYCKKCENKQTYESRKDVQYENNKEYLKEYYKENREQINEWRRSHFKDRRKNDTLFRCYIIMSRMVNCSYRNSEYEKKSKSQDIVGLSKQDLMIYLESKFEDWMSWDNYGLCNGKLNYGWDVDHIIPLSSAKTEEEMLKLNHYTNLQPLCSYTNRYIKRDIIQETSKND
jgi:hypothetical protein